MTRHDRRFPSSTLPAAVALALALAGCHRATPAEREAERIVAKNAAARGGRDAWRAVRSMSMSGRLEAGRPRDPVKLAMSFLRPRTQVKADARRAMAQARPVEPVKPVELPFTMELKRPRRSRVEVLFKGQTAVQVFDGKKGWKLRPFLGRHEVEPYSAEELRVAAQQSELDGPLMESAANGDRVELAGTDKVDGRDAYRLEITSASGQVRRVWVDTETYLDVKVDGTRKLDGKLRPVFTSFRDYRAVGGLMIPHVLETAVEGVPGTEKITVERVSLNAKLDDARFARLE
jgi:hypothetical protein